MIKWFQVLVLSAGLVFGPSAWAADGDAQGKYYKRPGYVAITGDLVIARPLLIAATGLGGVIWVASLPFTLPTGTAIEASQSLIIDPAMSAFVRCMGCFESGWRKLPSAADDYAY